MAIPAPIKKWIRQYITGEGASEVSSQAPVQSVNGEVGDVTVSGGLSPTVATYDDLPSTPLTEPQIRLVSGEEDLVGTTVLDPVQWRSLSDFTIVANPISDTSMLQSPIYQFWAGDSELSAGESGGFPEFLGGLPDATATGDPTFQPDYQNTGRGAFDYDAGSDGDNDYHTSALDANFPTGSNATVSLIVLFYVDSADDGSLATIGGDNIRANIEGGSYSASSGGGNNIGGGGTVSTGVLDTIMVRYDAGSDTMDVYGGGDTTAKASGSSSFSLVEDASIGALPSGSFPFDGGVFEVIISDVLEAPADYSTLHDDRTN